MLRGVDVSSYQANYTPEKDIALVFVKATEGTTYKNPYHDGQVKRARAAGCVVGHYHWLHSGNIAKQVTEFLDYANPKAGDLLACDWEQSGVSNADKDAFLAELDRQASQREGLYCNVNWWLNVDRTGKMGQYLWIAYYVSDTDREPPIKTPWTIWQHSQSPIDQNLIAFDTLADLRTWAGGADTPADVAPVAAADENVVAVAPTLGSVQTKFGQWGSSWSWNWNGSEGQHGGEDWHRNAGDAEIGDPIYAVADGRVIFAGASSSLGWGSAFGNHVLITWDHKQPGEDFYRTSIDAHMSKTRVSYGQRVKAGDLIGYKGKTGNVTGAHDHHEQHAGQGWGDRRLKPVYPGKTITTSPAPNMEDDVPERIAFSNPNDQVLGTAYQWLWLDVKKHTSVVLTPGLGFATIYLAIDGMVAGDAVHLYQAAYDVDKATNKTVKRGSNENVPIKIDYSPSGWPRVSIPIDWNLGDQAKGFDYRGLRLRVKANRSKTDKLPPIVLKDVQVSGFHWPN